MFILTSQEMMSRVDQPIIHHLPIIEHFGKYFSIFLHFEQAKVLYGMPSQALQIIFEMQSQRTNQKKGNKENMFFSNYKFFSF
jgi:hypothetical protein